VERASRLIVIASLALGVAAHAWLAYPQATPAVAAAVAFVALFLVTRWSLTLGLGIVAASAYMAPALLMVAFAGYDYHHLGIWIAAAAGALAAHADPARWHVPDNWRFPIIGWALVLAVTWPVVALREIDFSLVAAGTYGVANSVAQQSPPLASAFTILMALTQLVGLLWIDLLFARFRNDDRAFARRVVVPFLAGIVLSAGVAIYQRTVDADFLNLPIWSNLLRAGGLMNDANTLAMGAAIWAPLAIATAWTLRLPWISAAYGVLAAGMWAGGSRTALLAFAAGTIGLIVAMLQRRGWWQPRVGRVAALLGVAVVILVVAMLPREFNAGNPLMRALDRLPRLDSDEIRRFVIDDLWVRFGYGEAAVDIVRDHPLTGIGAGAFHLVGPEYIYRERGVVIASDNAQNWWRHQLAELGVLGALPALWASVLVFGLLRGEAEGEPPGAIALLRSVLVGVGLASVLGVPTQHPATWIAFATAVFWLHTLLRADARPAVATRSAPLAAALAIALVTAIGLAITARGELRPLTRALTTVVPHVQGLSPIEGVSDYGEFRWSGTRALAAMPVRGRWMQLTLWAPYSDVDRRAIVAAVSVNGREVVRHAFADADAATYFIEVPAGERAVAVSFVVSGQVPQQRAIQLATLWRAAPPPGARADRVVR
jgi:hypothetical protein